VLSRRSPLSPLLFADDAAADFRRHAFSFFHFRCQIDDAAFTADAMPLRHITPPFADAIAAITPCEILASADFFAAFFPADITLLRHFSIVAHELTRRLFHIRLFILPCHAAAELLLLPLITFRFSMPCLPPLR